MNVSLRVGRPDDAETCGLICYEAFKAIAGQHNFPHDFHDPSVAVGLLTQLFSRSDIYSVVAEVDGRIVGSNFLWENAIVAGVGPVTVDPGVQNLALGRRLMDDVMRRAQEFVSRESGQCRPLIIIARYLYTLSLGSTRVSLFRLFKVRLWDWK